MILDKFTKMQFKTNDYLSSNFTSSSCEANCMCCNSKCNFNCIHDHCAKRRIENIASSSGIFNNNSIYPIVCGNFKDDDVASSSTYYPKRTRRDSPQKSPYSHIKYVNPQKYKSQCCTPDCKETQNRDYYSTNNITIQTMPAKSTQTPFPMAQTTQRSSLGSSQTQPNNRITTIGTTTTTIPTNQMKQMVCESTRELPFLTNTSKNLKKNKLLIEEIRKQMPTNFWQNSANRQKQSWSVKSPEIDPLNILTSSNYNNQVNRGTGIICKSSSTIFSPGCTSRDNRSTTAH